MQESSSPKFVKNTADFPNYLGLSDADLKKQYEMTEMHLWAQKQSQDKHLKLDLLRDRKEVNSQDYRGNTPLFYLLQNFVYKQDAIVPASIEVFSVLYPDVSIQNRAGETALEYFLSYLKVTARKLTNDERDKFLLVHFADVLPCFYFDKDSLMQVVHWIPKELGTHTALSGVVGYMAFLEMGHENAAEIIRQSNDKIVYNDEFNIKVAGLVAELGLENTITGGAILLDAAAQVKSFIDTNPFSIMGRAIDISTKMLMCKECLQEPHRKPLWDWLPNIASIINGHRDPLLIEGALEVSFQAFNKRKGVNTEVGKSDAKVRYKWVDVTSNPMYWIDQYLGEHYKLRHAQQQSK